VRDISREVRLLVGRFGSARARPLTLRQQQRLAWRAQAGDRQAGAKLVESCPLGMNDSIVPRVLPGRDKGRGRG
jgi:hypothetical protein